MYRLLPETAQQAGRQCPINLGTFPISSGPSVPPERLFPVGAQPHAGTGRAGGTTPSRIAFPNTQSEPQGSVGPHFRRSTLPSAKPMGRAVKGAMAICRGRSLSSVPPRFLQPTFAALLSGCRCYSAVLHCSQEQRQQDVENAGVYGSAANFQFSPAAPSPSAETLKFLAFQPFANMLRIQRRIQKSMS